MEQFQLNSLLNGGVGDTEHIRMRPVPAKYPIVLFDPGMGLAVGKLTIVTSYVTICKK